MKNKNSFIKVCSLNEYPQFCSALMEKSKYYYSKLIQHLSIFFFCPFLIFFSNIPTLNINLGCFMRKPNFCVGENKNADQLHRCTADQPLCFCLITTCSTIPLRPESKTFKPVSIKCTAWFVSNMVKTFKTSFPVLWLILSNKLFCFNDYLNIFCITSSAIFHILQVAMF